MVIYFRRTISVSIINVTDDTSIIIKDSNGRDFNINANQVFQDINTWFNAYLLTLNFNKTHYLEFRSKNYYNVNTQIKYIHECIMLPRLHPLD
jgi:hypothetical protein